MTSIIKIDQLKCFMAGDSSVRVDRRIAKQWLLDNQSIVLGGNIRYLRIKDLGLGVCEVRLREIGEVGTFMVKTFNEV